MHLPWIEFAASLLVVALCIPLILRKVRRNPWYGLRTSRTMNGTPEEWYAANRVAGRVMLACGLASAAADVVLAFLPIPRQTMYLIATTILMAAVLLPLVTYRKRFF
jgi:hypothetical protein